MAALDSVAAARADGADLWPKFRTGGLAAELFPTPAELAAVICACRDRNLRFKLTAGLHHAVRHTDPATGFVHHGFLNVLIASAVAADGGDTAAVAAVLSGTDPAPLVEHAEMLARLAADTRQKHLGEAYLATLELYRVGKAMGETDAEILEVIQPIAELFSSRKKGPG